MQELLFRKWILSVIGFFLVGVVTANAQVTASPSHAASSTTISWAPPSGSNYNVNGYKITKFVNGVADSTVELSDDVRSYTYTGLTTGTYQFRVHAKILSWVMIRGELYPSVGELYMDLIVVDAKGSPGRPGTPTFAGLSHSGKDKDGAFTVAWTAGANTPDRYELYQKKNSGSWARIYNGSNRSLSRSLGDGTYYYKLRSCTANECSAYTNISSLVVIRTPSVPGSISGPSSNATGSFNLGWAASTGSVTYYRLQQQKGGGAFSSIQSNLNLAASISGLADGNYGYRIQACNSLSCSAFTSTKSVWVLKTPGVPGSITLPSTNTTGSYAVSWSASSGTVGNYELQRRRPSAGWSGIQTSMALSASENSVADGTYEYRLRACNALSCSAWGPTKSIEVLRTPGSPNNVSAPRVSSSGVYALTWSGVSGTVDSYQVDEQQDGGPFARISTATATNVGFSKIVEARYGYRVRACNSLSCSAWSATATTTFTSDGLMLWSKKGAASLINDKALPGQTGTHDATVGELNGKAGVSGGAATYKVPIAIPPGRNQVQPEVSLRYSSRAGNSIAGMGWSLASTSSIRRCSATQAQDGFEKNVTFEADDRLCLDGHRLQLLSGTYGSSGAVYATELDSFVRVTQSGSLASTASFTVRTKNGRTRYYGTTADSRVVPGGLTFTYEWFVKQEEDPSGNSIIYTYAGYGPGEVLVASIQYTGRGSVPGSREITFEYQNRPDMGTTYISGGLMARSQRLSAIKTFVDYDPVREYALGYLTSVTTGRSLLRNITECAIKNGNRACRPATTFNWYHPAVSHAAPRALEQSDHLGAAGTFKQADVNGDGRNELLVSIPENYPLVTSYTTEINYLDEDFNLDSSITPNPIDFSTAYGQSSRPLADIDLDGRPDAIVFSQDGQLTYHSYGNSGSVANTVSISHPGTPLSHSHEFTDLNGDGYVDFLMREKFGAGYGVVAFLHNRNGNNPGFYSVGAVTTNMSEEFVAQDLNGDGLQDILFTYTRVDTKEITHRVVYGRTTSGNFSFGSSVPGASIGLPANSFYNQSTFADVNGDSLPDFISAENAGWHVRLNTGNSFRAPKAIGTSHGMHLWQLPDYARNQATFGGLVVLDFDQDGDQEILVATHTNDSFCYSRISGGGFSDQRICDDALQGGADENGQHHGISYKQYDGRRFYWSLIDIEVGTNVSGAITIASDVRQNIVLAGLPGNAHGGGLRALDLNGDGAPELFNRIRTNYCLDNRNGGYCGSSGVTDHFEIFALQQDPATELPPGYYVFENTSGVADHMHEAITGLGKKASWNYAAISQSGGRAAGETKLYQVPLNAGARYVPSDPGSEYFYFGSSMHVVEAFSESNGLSSNLNTTSYAYREAVYNRQGRGFQGFRTIIAEDRANATRTVADYHQIFPLAGKLEQTRTCLLTDDERCTTSPISKTTYRYTTRTVAGTAVSWSYPHSTVTIKYDLSSRSYLSSVSRSIDSVDQYGNVLEESTTTDTGFGTITTSMSREYSYDAANWWVDRLVSETQTTNPVSDRRHPLTSGELIVPGTGMDSPKVVKAQYLLWNESQRLPTQVKTSALQGGGRWVQKDYAYNTDGHITSETTRAEGESQIRQVRTSYSADGYFPDTITRENGNFDLITQQTVDPRYGDLTAEIDPNGLITTIDYDAFGRPTMILEPGAPAKFKSLQWCSTCNESDAVFTRTKVQDGVPTEVAYVDQLGRERRIETEGFEGGAPIVVTKQFNARGLLSFESVPSYTGSSLGTHFDSYDELGRLVDKRVDQMAHQALSINYHHDGYRTTVTAGGLVMSRAYNGIGQLMQTTDAIGGVTQYIYDGASNPIVVQDANGNQIRASYNALAQKSWVDDPNMGSKQFGYNGFGETSSETDANNDTTRYVHDLQGRVVERLVNGVSEASFEYDTAANGLGLLAVEQRNDQNAFVRSYTYDGFSRPTHVDSIIDGSNYTVQTEYDANYGRIKGLVYPTGLKIAYKYESAGYLKSLENASSGYVYREFDSMDARGNWITASAPDAGIQFDRSYDGATGQMLSTAISRHGAMQQELRYSAYDVFGNLKQVTVDNMVGGTLYRSNESFYYDSLHRLERNTRSTSAPSIQFEYPTINYAYDGVGNLLSKDDYANSYAYGGATGGPNAVSQITRLDGTIESFSYDANGNLIAGANRAISYNTYNKPVSLTRNGDLLHFFYAADQMRYKQQKTTSVGSETTIYIDKLFEKVTKGSSVEYRHYIGDFAIVKDTVESGFTSTEIAYLHRDRLGSMAAEVGPDGHMIGAYSFDPFGRPRDGQLVEREGLTSLFTLRGFTDHEHMNEMELIHMNGRAFDYNLGRFLSVDPVIQFEGNSQSINPYSYIMNNPLAGTDPSGYEAKPLWDDRSICNLNPLCGVTEFNATNAGQRFAVGNGKESDVAAQAGAANRSPSEIGAAQERSGAADNVASGSNEPSGGGASTSQGTGCAIPLRCAGNEYSSGQNGPEQFSYDGLTVGSTLSTAGGFVIAGDKLYLSNSGRWVPVSPITAQKLYQDNLFKKLSGARYLKMTGNVLGGTGVVVSGVDYGVSFKNEDYRGARKSGVDALMGLIMFKFPVGTVVGGVGLYVNHDYHEDENNP